MIQHKSDKYRSSRLIFVPTFYIMFSGFLVIIVPKINQEYFPWLVSPLESAIIIPILSSITSGMIAFTGIVFSMIFVILQFQSGTYSPRLVHALQQDVTPHAIGIFTGTFIYTLLSIRAVDAGDVVGTSSLVMWFALLWLLGSIFMLVILVLRVGDLRIERVLYLLSFAGNKAVNLTELVTTKTYLVRGQVKKNIEPPGPVAQQITYYGSPKYFLAYHIKMLVGLAVRYNCTIHLPRYIGDCITENEKIVIVFGKNQLSEVKVKKCLLFGWRNTLSGNPGYAIRLLVDIAIRALSPAVNDPTTAVQSLDQIQSLLLRIGKTNLFVNQITDSSGIVRLILTVPSWEDYLELSLLEIIQYGSNSLQVLRRVGAMLSYLKSNLPEDFHTALDRFEVLRNDKINSSVSDETYRQIARLQDIQGLGHTNS
jgi:uncharacterized membrane protein